MKISDKLDSIEAVKAAMGGANYGRLKDDMVYRTKILPSWWAVREQWRLNEGYHEITDALAKVNEHAKVFSHVSKADRTKVAFTPDKAFGERDAQLQMNFGKFVQRVIPFASDEYVKTLTESHVADLSNEVEWIEGAQIAEVYRTTSVGSCMAKSKNYWLNAGLPAGVEPALAYAAPGIKMAVLRDADGSINARCMVYENGDDKRMIRAYGDGALKKRLSRLGYKLGGWQGVHFNTVKWSVGDNAFRVVVPYLDAQGGGCNTKDCSVMLLDGELLGIRAENLEGLMGAGVSMTVPGTSGSVILRNTASEDFLVDDLLSGEKLNVITDKAVKIGLQDGQCGVTKTLDNEVLNRDYTTCRVLVNGNITSGYWVRREHTFEHSWDTYVDSEDMRRFQGFKKLSPTYYTEGLDSWLSDLVVVVEGEVSHNIKKEDAVHYYQEDHSTRIHKSKVPKKAVRLANVDGETWYASPETEVLRTPSKAKVVVGVHAIREGWQGFDYTRNLNKATDVFNSRVFHKAADSNKPEFLNFIAERAKTRLTEIYEDTSRTLQGLFGLLVPVRRYVYPSDSNIFFKGNAVYNSNVSSMNLAEFKEFLEDYKKACPDAVSKALGDFCLTKIAEMEATNGEEPVLNIEPPAVILRELEAA
jgi:hypothetical protein